MQQTDTEQLATLRMDKQSSHLRCSGCWTLAYTHELYKHFQETAWPDETALTLDGGNIQQLDTAGAWLLQNIINYLQQHLQKKIELINFTEQHQALIDLITQKAEIVAHKIKLKRDNPFAALGRKVMELVDEAINFISFIGELFIVMLNSLRHLKILQWKLMLNTINVTGFQALPIVGLLSFLIGVVLAYQMGVQLESYGANVYIVDLLGIAIFREFGPLITAIIVAGRTSSSFTAEIGTMKVHEEVDALRTFGLVPAELLALPKIVGLTIAMPLLTLWSDLFGVFGGMIMSKNMLHINFYDFLARFKQNISLTHFMIGIGKAPAFAILIAMVGCFHGFRVSGSADSVGTHTTKSVVLAIFLIIIADAVFSVIFSWQGI